MTRGEASMKQTPVVTCWLCEREMGKQECLYDHVVINGDEYRRVRVLESPFYEGEPNCECGCEIGQVHQVECDLEDCPRCGGQFLGCLMNDGCEVEDFFYFEAQQEQNQG